VLDLQDPLQSRYKDGAIGCRTDTESNDLTKGISIVLGTAIRIGGMLYL
jgi:hypothetical protein